MGLQSELGSLAEVIKSPASVVVLLAAFWNFGVTPVVYGTLLFLGAFLATLLLVEFKNELVICCGHLRDATVLILRATGRALRLFSMAARRTLEKLRQRA